VRFTLMAWAASFAAILCLATPAKAEIEYYKNDLVDVRLGLSAGAIYFQNRNSNFGQGDKNASTNTSTTWNEGFVEPSVKVDFNLEDKGTIYTGFSVIGSYTRGDGDPTGLTQGEPEDIDVDDAYIGWKSSKLNNETLGDYTLDLSTGRQFYTIGDGFLVGDPHFDQGEEGALYLSPRNSFKNTFIVKFDNTTYHADVFMLKLDKDQTFSRVYGTNLEYRATDKFTYGFAYLSIVDSDNAFNPSNLDSRDGLKTTSARFQGNPFSVAPNWFVSGEAAYQWNDRSTKDVRAYAYYGEVGYTFAEFPWKPSLNYRYMTYSGDKASSADTDEGFDSLFYGFGRGRGAWFLGEVVGEYTIFNTNEHVHMVQLNVNPLQDVTTGFVYYNFERDQPVVGTAKGYANEVDLFADYRATSWLTLSTTYASAFPDSAAKAENNGFNDTYSLLLFSASINF
jgi:hypothetical protein